MIGAWIILIASIACLIGGMRGWLHRTPGASRAGRVAASVWAPMVATVPAVMANGASDATWAVGLLSPLCALAVVPLLLVSAAAGRSPDPWFDGLDLPMVWPATGVLALLIAVAGSLPLSGVLALAAIAVVVLMAQSTPRPGEGWGGAGTVYLGIALLGSAAMGWLLRPDGVLVASLVPMVIVFSVLVRKHGPGHGIVAAMSAGVLGTLVVPGMLGFDTLVSVLQGHQPAVSVTGVPRTPSLVPLVMPGAGLLAMSGLLVGFTRWGSTRRWAAIVASAALVAGCGAVLTAVYVHQIAH